jgi:Na+/H+ antiporter NhaA
MAIFIANLAFDSPDALAAAKVAVVLASCLSAMAALGFGRLAFR